MNIQPLVEWGKRFKGFLGIVAFILVVLLAGITYLFKQGSLDQLLANFGKLTGDQFLTVVYLALGLPFAIIMLLIILSYKSTRPQVERGEMVIYVQVSDSETKQRLAGAQVHVSFRGTQAKTTDTTGEATFIFPAIYKGETCTIDVFREGYRHKSVREKLGKKPDVYFSLVPEDKHPSTPRLKQKDTQKGNSVGPDADRKIQNSPRRAGDGTMDSNTVHDQPSLSQRPEPTVPNHNHHLAAGKRDERDVPGGEKVAVEEPQPLKREERLSLPNPDSVFLFNVQLPDPTEFYGRTNIRATLISRTRKGASTSIVGPRRIGKTWLLNYLPLVASQELGSGFRVGYLDATLPRCATVPGFTARALEELGNAVVGYAALGLDTLEQVVKDLRMKNQTLVLCIDEFEGLCNQQEFSLSFFSELRAIAQAGLVLIIASKQPIIEMVGDQVKTSPFFNIFAQLKLQSFSAEEAKRFVQKKSVQAGFTEQEQTYLLEYATKDGQLWPPLRLQLVGKMLLEDKNRSVTEVSNYYRPNELDYRRDFEKRLEETYQGAVGK